MDTILIILNDLKALGISDRRIAKAIGVSSSTISRLRSRSQKDTSVNVYMALRGLRAKYLGMKARV